MSDLATLIATERPVPRAAFTDELDGRVAAGFARPTRARRTWKRPSLRPALTVAVPLLLVAVAAAAILRGQRDTPGVTAVSAPAGSAPASAPAAAADSGGSTSGSGAAGSASGGNAKSGDSAGDSVYAAPFPGRTVERAMQLTLGVRASRIQATAQRVYGVVGAFGGIVDSSTVSATGGDGSGASFELRLPAARSGVAVARLAALGKVRSQTGTTTDVTSSVTSSREALRRVIAERSGLLRALAKAPTATAIDAIKQRLRIVERQINGVRASLGQLHAQVAYARVHLELTPIGPAPAHHHHGGGGGYTSRDALGDAGRILRVAAAVALVCLLLALPVALLGGGATVAGRRLRQRRREAALG